MRVLKFGGAALRDGPAVGTVARIVRQHGGERPLVVVSAHAGVTELLRAAARDAEERRPGLWAWDALRIRHRSILSQLGLPGDLLDRHLRELRGVLEALASGPGPRAEEERRARDFVLSFGERMSARVVAAVFRRQGVSATPLDAFDLGLVTEDGRPAGLDPAPARVGELLRAVPGLPVVTGFLALDRSGHLTTLGPNGSDLSAVWFGEAVGAEEVQLWKCVPGVLTADPELVPGARRLARLGWDEALQLAVHGSRVLHPGAIVPARRARMVVALRDVEHPDDAGTRIEGETPGEGPLALAHRPSLALVSRPLGGERGRAEALAGLFERLGETGLEPYLGDVSGTTARVLVPDGPELARFTAGASTNTTVEHGLASLAIVGRRIDRSTCAAGLEILARRSGIALRRPPAQDGEASPTFLLERSGLGTLAGAVHERWLAPIAEPAAEPAAEIEAVLPRPEPVRTVG